MKTTISVSVFAFIICTAFKPQAITDYRDNHTGVYFCSKKCRSMDNQGKGINTTTDTISISITKDPVDSILQVKIDQKILKVKLISGSLAAFPYGGHYKGQFFASDSINFIYGSGRSSSCTYEGKKK